MLRIVLGLMVVALALPLAWADDKPNAPADSGAKDFEKLKEEFAAAQHQFNEQAKASAEAAKKRGSPPRPIPFEDGPGYKFSPRFLALAEKYPDGDPGFQAVCIAIQYSGGPTNKSGIWGKAITLLKEHYATKPQIKVLLRSLGMYNDEGADGLVRDVIARNPDRKLQALACRSLLTGLQGVAEMIGKIKGDPEIRQSFVSVRGKAYVDKLLAEHDKKIKEAAELKKMLQEKYADVLVDVAVGKPAPEIVSQDIDGKETKLSDLKGKVVVLDIWATWCPPCRDMIPHEREMVERLKDKPFALVSISADEKKETLKDFLSKEKMPWTHWWNGTEGSVIEDWNIQYFPTVYVIDAQGVVRHKDLRDQQLETAVNELLKEVAPKKAG